MMGSKVCLRIEALFNQPGNPAFPHPVTGDNGDVLSDSFFEFYSALLL